MDADRAEAPHPNDRTSPPPRISIVINTDGRAKSLEATLRSLRYLTYPNFEVCVVYGPTPDGTREMLEGWKGCIKTAPCPELNLSRSRNIGIALAAGDVVALIDDDAIPEPEWLDDIAAAYRTPDVGAAGGFVYDHTGAGFQWRYGTVDRLARPTLTWDRAVPEMCFPYTANIPHLLGTNSSLLREAVIAVGGFDEEYDYFLDETDVLCRMVDAGWTIKQLPQAYVHHKYRPSHIRKEVHVLQSWYSIIKNKIYFCILNARGHHTLQQAMEEITRYVTGHREQLKSAMSTGRLNENDAARFEEEVERAWRAGLQAGLAGRRRLLTEEMLARYSQAFLPFDIHAPQDGRLTLCLLSQQYPPEAVGGVGRYVHQLAEGIARLGHHVHVLTKAEQNDTVDFENGVWVHRIRPKPSPPAITLSDIQVPQNIWEYSATMLAEAKKIATKRRVDAVLAPIWDCEGAAFLADPSFCLITCLQTTLKFWLESHAHRLGDEKFMTEFVRPMLMLEKRLMQESNSVWSISHAIARDVERAYGFKFDTSRVSFVPLGVEDWTARPLIAPAAVPNTLRILFVGRLEERKGIDVLFDAIKTLLPLYPAVQVDIVGDSTLIGAGDKTYKQLFLADPRTQPIRDRVTFHGSVSDEELRGFYGSCDLFAAPSRYESFGLILLEAMIYSKPVIGSNVGGMTEVVEHGVSGLLAEPGNARSLTACIRQLLDDPEMRRRLGAAGRRRYEQLFKPEHMVNGVIGFVADLAAATRRACRPSTSHNNELV